MAMARMSEGRFPGHIPVVKRNDELAGMVSNWRSGSKRRIADANAKPKI